MRDSLTLNTLLQTVKVDETKPTLLLSEVVLTYMGRSSCNRVIQWILDFFQECILTTYEQVCNLIFSNEELISRTIEGFAR